MESRFPQRVALERRALDTVHLQLGGACAPLAGLTYAAIRIWARQFSELYTQQSSDAVVAALYQLAEAARSEADVSDEIFSDVSPEEAEDALAALRVALANLKQA
jgi:hypothetical protein